MNDIHQNFSLQSFRKTVQANWTDMRRMVFVEAVQSHGTIYFRYNPQKATCNIVSDTWIYKLQKYGKEFGDIDNEISCFQNEVSCALSLDHDLINFLGTKAIDEPGHLSEDILISLIYEIEKQLINDEDNIIPFPQKQEKAK